MATEQRTSYAIVKVVSSTGFKQTKEKLKKTFAYLGIPRRVTLDNGPPFNLEQCKAFAKEKRICKSSSFNESPTGKWAGGENYADP